MKFYSPLYFRENWAWADDVSDKEKTATLVNNDYTAVARIVLEGFGGKENIKSAGVARPSQKDVQVVIGMQVQHVADEFKKLLK